MLRAACLRPANHFVDLLCSSYAVIDSLSLAYRLLSRYSSFAALADVPTDPSVDFRADLSAFTDLYWSV